MVQHDDVLVPGHAFDLGSNPFDALALLETLGSRRVKCFPGRERAYFQRFAVLLQLGR